MTKTSPRRRKNRFFWEDLPQRELFEVRLCDLGLRLRGTWLEERIERVRAELLQERLRLHPHFWLSDEWFSPAKVPGVAIPFYLTHPRLMRLERSQMLEVEGGTMDSCLQLLRHEVGHAMMHGFQLQRRREWTRVFGKASKPYPKAYRPDPASRRYVQHLDAWYAQAHPEEDFAETFAVWLRPRSNWRKRYAGWPALRKLQYVDRLMDDLAGQLRKINSRSTPYSLPGVRMTLGEYYEKKRAHYSIGHSTAFDRDLKRLFADKTRSQRGETAVSFLRRHRREIRELVCKWTGDYQFTLDQVLNEMITRCKELKLMARGPERRLVLDFAILTTVHSMYRLHRGRREWHAM